jgi:hypothetical protein
MRARAKGDEEEDAVAPAYREPALDELLHRAAEIGQRVGANQGAIALLAQQKYPTSGLRAYRNNMRFLQTEFGNPMSFAKSDWRQILSTG